MSTIKRFRFSIVLSFVILLLFFLSVFFLRPTVDAQTTTSPMYKVVYLETASQSAEKIQSLLNKMEDEGWTYHSSIISNDQNIVVPTAYLIFKKTK